MGVEKPSGGGGPYGSSSSKFFLFFILQEGDFGEKREILPDFFDFISED
tara:strand:- start:1260 stop:1406 length:147 start_codon:yes stop_codon:yes gene_type:complete